MNLSIITHTHTSPSLEEDNLSASPHSVEDAVAQVVLVEESRVLFEGNAEAVEHVVDVGLGEEGGVTELGLVGVQVVVVLDGFDDVAELHGLEHLLGGDGVEVVDGDEEVAEVALSLLEGGGVSEGSLVVGDGPLGGAHHSEIVVAVGVQ